MKILLGKLNFFSATICLLAAMFALVAVSNLHKISEAGSSTENVEVDVEKYESVAQREKRRTSDLLRPALDRRPEKLLTFSNHFKVLTRFNLTPTERNQLNGFGGYLRT